MLQRWLLELTGVGGGVGGDGFGTTGFDARDSRPQDDDRGRDGRQLFSHEVASRTKYDDMHPEDWLERTTNYLVDRGICD